MSKGGRAREGKPIYKTTVVSSAGILQLHACGRTTIHSQKQRHNAGRLCGAYEYERAKRLQDQQTNEIKDRTGAFSYAMRGF